MEHYFLQITVTVCMVLLSGLSGDKLDLYAMKLQVLGPFLFGQQTLCDKVGQAYKLSII